MFQDEINYLYILFIWPIISEFDRANMLFQSKNPVSAKLFQGLGVHARSMLSRFVLKKHACPTAEWETRLLHIRVHSYGTVLLDAFQKCSLLNSEKDEMLDHCHLYPVAFFKSLLKKLLDNLDLLQKFKLLTTRRIRDMLYRTFNKVICIVEVPFSTSALDANTKLCR